MTRVTVIIIIKSPRRVELEYNLIAGRLFPARHAAAVLLLLSLYLFPISFRVFVLVVVVKLVIAVHRGPGLQRHGTVELLGHGSMRTKTV